MTFLPLPLDIVSVVPGTRICVAVSGGADSVALLRALIEANRSERTSLGIGISAVHVNHGLRGQDAYADESFVQALCDNLGVPLRIRRVDVRAYRDLSGETLEEAARTLRYQIFQAVLADDGVDDLMTAHTLDDQAETVLMKLLRGAWTKGLSGIHPSLKLDNLEGKRILRPLLGTSRARILAYLGETNQGWREDASNFDAAHTRNRIRHHILPILQAENPSLTKTLANLAELAREEEDHWQGLLSRMLPQLLLPGTPVRGGGRSVATKSGTATVAVELDRLRALDRPTIRRVLRESVRSLSPRESQTSSGAGISFDETKRLMSLCGFCVDPTVSSRPGTVLQLGGGLIAKRSARELVFSLRPGPVPTKCGAKQ